MISPVDLKLAYRLINHGPTTLITSAHHGKQNVMAAAWVCALDFSPPKLTVVIDKNTYTRSLIEASGTFAVNIPSVSQAEMVHTVGTSTGKDLIDTNKFSLHKISTFNGEKVTAPLIEGCVAWLECEVIPHLDIQNAYDLFLAEVVSASADDRVFSNGHWHFEGNNELRTLHHIAGGTFFTTGELVSTKS
jgi:flavin reductase (DIM6/NTAB) family NADH-FMN oxidoreductase RutF